MTAASGAAAAGTLTGALLTPLLAAPHQPRVTFYDGSGARTELSSASLTNWAAKVAGLLTDELGARPGDRVHVALPPGWLHLPVLLGAWWAGATVVGTDDAAAVAAFVSPGADASADEVFVVSPHPLGLAASGLLAHQRDLGDAARPHADRYTPPRVPADLPAVDDLTVAAVLDRARAAGDALGPGARVLVGGGWSWPDPGVAHLLGPLAAGGSVVAAAPELDPKTLARLIDGERVTARR